MWRQVRSGQARADLVIPPGNWRSDIDFSDLNTIMLVQRRWWLGCVVLVFWCMYWYGVTISEIWLVLIRLSSPPQWSEWLIYLPAWGGNTTNHPVINQVVQSTRLQVSQTNSPVCALIRKYFSQSGVNISAAWKHPATDWVRTDFVKR